MRADRPDATPLQSPCALSCPTLSARAARRTRAVPAVPVGSGPLRRPRVAPVRAGRGSDLPHALRRAARSRDPGVGGRAEPRECAKGSGDPRNSPRRGSCDAVFHPPPLRAPRGWRFPEEPRHRTSPRPPCAGPAWSATASPCSAPAAPPRASLCSCRAAPPRPPGPPRCARARVGGAEGTGGTGEARGGRRRLGGDGSAALRGTGEAGAAGRGARRGLSV